MPPGDIVNGLDQISHAMGEGGVAATTIRNDFAQQEPRWREPARMKTRKRQLGEELRIEDDALVLEIGDAGLERDQRRLPPSRFDLEQVAGAVILDRDDCADARCPRGRRPASPIRSA